MTTNIVSTYVVSNGQEFLDWCRQHRIKNCLLESVRHIPNREQVDGIMSAAYPHRIVVLKSAPFGALCELRNRGYRIKIEARKGEEANVTVW